MEMFNTNAEFSIEKETESFIYIKDTGNHSERRTITNDPEFVVKVLYEQYNLENKCIFYMDSEGRIDEITHTYGKFTGFKAGHQGVHL